MREWQFEPGWTIQVGDDGAISVKILKDDKKTIEASTEVTSFLDKTLHVPGQAHKATRDVVNHPGHYESGKFECIEVMEETQGTEAVLAFCICNAFKYLYRHRRKNGIEDVKKARWYLDKYIEIVERGQADDQGKTASV